MLKKYLIKKKIKNKNNIVICKKFSLKDQWTKQKSRMELESEYETSLRGSARGNRFNSHLQINYPLPRLLRNYSEHTWLMVIEVSRISVRKCECTPSPISNVVRKSVDHFNNAFAI